LTDVLERAAVDEEFLKRLREQPQEAIKEYVSSLNPEERDALVDLFEKLKGAGLAAHIFEEVFLSSRRAFTHMLIMNWVIFSVGVILVLLSIWLGVSGQREVYVAIFGGMGIVSLIGYLLVRPMKGVRDALSDFLQAHIIYDSFNHQIGVWYHFKPSNIEETKEASKALQDIRESSVHLLQEALEDKVTKGKK